MTFYIPKKALLMCATRLRVADVFATSLYTGNGGTQTITNGLDLAGKGGLNITKARSAAINPGWIDTVRGANKYLTSQNTGAEASFSQTLTAFNSSGYTVGSDGDYNGSGTTYVGWSFRRAKKFFDTVTYTGNGVAGRQIPHGLDAVPGMIVVKSRNIGGSNWPVYHRAMGPTQFMFLEGTGTASANPNIWNDTAPTSSTFAVGTNGNLNNPGAQYVAYLFAHNPDLIDCGSYVGTGSAAGPMVTCGKGWRPQFLITKAASAAGYSWIINDAARGLTGAEPSLFANQSTAESSTDRIEPTATGFQPVADSGLNVSGITYVYLAIRSPT